MDASVSGKLLALNKRFYEGFGDAFAATRRRIQPGVSAVLEQIPPVPAQDWLDLGCGSGELGRIWAGQGRRGSYTGLDFSNALLKEAEQITAGLSNENLHLRYLQGDLMDPGWPEGMGKTKFDGILAFASLHHIPGRGAHLRILRQIGELLKTDGCFWFSVWQFQNSEKLLKRVQPWEKAGFSPDELEEGDTLLDWRYALPTNEEKQGLRYVHRFREEELDDLAAQSGFLVKQRFYSDGAEGNLALYEQWVKTDQGNASADPGNGEEK